MTEQRKPNQIPDSVREEANNFIRQAFGFFSDHCRQLAEGLREFNSRKKEVDERIDRGARQTNGRIV